MLNLGTMYEGAVTNKQLRLDDDLVAKLKTLIERTRLSESDVLRTALRVGLNRLLRGAENPFAESPDNPDPLPSDAAQNRKTK